MEINKKELKELSLDFRSISSRLMKSDRRNAMSLMKMFLNFLDSRAIIKDYILNCVEQNPQENLEENIGHCFSSLGDTIDEEISFIYQYLKYGVENSDDYYRTFARGYMMAFDESIQSFNNDVVLPLIYHIEQYLTKLSIRMGYDEEIKYMITIDNNSGQINIAQGNSTATLNNGINANELEGIMKLIYSKSVELDEEHQEIVVENSNFICDELKMEKPRKGLIKTCISGLNAIMPLMSNFNELSDAVNKLMIIAQSAI